MSMIAHVPDDCIDTHDTLHAFLCVLRMAAFAKGKSKAKAKAKASAKACTKPKAAVKPRKSGKVAIPEDGLG